MKVFGIIGFKNSGKTTLVERLVTELTGRGLRVSTVKHAHHNFDLDQPGKDSARHREAGASQVVIASANRWAVMSELRGDAEPTLAELLARLDPVDLVLVEGFKGGDHPRLEVHRSATDHPLIAAQDSAVLAIATDATMDAQVPIFALDDIAAIADFALDRGTPL